MDQSLPPFLICIVSKWSIFLHFSESLHDDYSDATICDSNDDCSDDEECVFYLPLLGEKLYECNWAASEFNTCHCYKYF